MSLVFRSCVRLCCCRHRWCPLCVRPLALVLGGQHCRPRLVVVGLVPAVALVVVPVLTVVSLSFPPLSRCHPVVSLSHCCLHPRSEPSPRSRPGVVVRLPSPLVVPVPFRCCPGGPNGCWVQLGGGGWCCLVVVLSCHSVHNKIE